MNFQEIRRIVCYDVKKEYKVFVLRVKDNGQGLRDMCNGNK